LADGIGLAGAQDRHRNVPIGAQEDAMTATADSTRTDDRMDLEGRPSQSPVTAFQAPDQAGSAVAPEMPPHFPASPHLPADIRRALADFDARVTDGRLPLAADGHPAIPVAAEAWISDFLRSRIPTEI
jgi:hypothetical protein